MATYCYIRASGIRKLAKEHGKRCSVEFLDELNRFVYDSICRCIQQFNGHKKTLDATVAQLILGKIKLNKGE